MNKPKTFQWTTLILALMNIALIAFVVFQRHGHRRPHGPDRNRHIIIEKLHLDDEQIANYDELIQIHRQTISVLDHDIMQARKELYSMLSGNDLTKKDALIEIINQKQKAVEEAHFQHFIEIKKMCRNDQLADYNELTKELAQLFSNHPEPKHPRHRGIY